MGSVRRWARAAAAQARVATRSLSSQSTICGPRSSRTPYRYGVVASRCLLVCAFVTAAAITQASAAQTCGTTNLSASLSVSVRTTGYTCRQARSVMRSFENDRVYRSPLYQRLADIRPYGRKSQPFSLPTALGTFTCTFAAEGLAGSEHDVACARRSRTVAWTTM